MALASVRVSSSVSLVRSVRTSRQSGSFAQRRPCIHERVSVLRMAVSALSGSSGVRGRGVGDSRSARVMNRQIGPTSGPMRLPSKKPTDGAMSDPQPRMNRSGPTPSRTACSAAR